MNSVTFVLTVAVMAIHSGHAGTCSQKSKCVFQTATGLVDLTTVFEKIPYVNASVSDGSYQFNPCKAFSCGGTEALLCHVITQFSIDLIDAGSNATCDESFKGSLALEYTSKNITLNVKLNCKTNNQTQLVFDGVTTGIYNFSLNSPYACEKPLPTTTPVITNSTTSATPMNTTRTTKTTNTTATTSTSTNTTRTTKTTNTTATTSTSTNTTRTTKTTNTTATTSTSTNTTRTTKTTNTTATTSTSTNTTPTTKTTNSTATTSTPTHSTITTMTTNMTATTANGTAMTTTTNVVTTNTTTPTSRHSTTPLRGTSIQPVGPFVVLTAVIVLISHVIQG